MCLCTLREQGSSLPTAQFVIKHCNWELRSVSLTLILGKMVEQRVLKAVFKHAKSRKVTETGQRGCTKGKSLLNDLIVTHDTMTSLVHQNHISTFPGVLTLSPITSSCTS